MHTQNDIFDDVDTTLVSTAALRDWPLPMPSMDGDKAQRGHVLIIGGSREMPGAVILAACAALRAGAGKLTIITGSSIAQLVALAIPESRVIAWTETPSGGIVLPPAEAFAELAEKVDAVLIGPGMQDEPAICSVVRALLPLLRDTRVILDACAMGVVRDAPTCLHGVDTHVLLTPHAGEMAHLCGISKEAVAADPRTAATRAAQRWNAVVALKGATTFIAAPGGRVWRHDGGNVGLAISGSGDTLAGIIAGLAARGAELEQAGAWGVALHARAGDQLAARTGPLGFLARDIAAEVPMLMHALTPR